MLRTNNGLSAARTTTAHPTTSTMSSSSSISSSSTTFSSSSRGQVPGAGGVGGVGGGGGAGGSGHNLDTIDNNNSSSFYRNQPPHTDSYLSEIKDKQLNAWIPPNDRELIFRAKLKTGWSSRSALSSTAASSNNYTTTAADITKMKYSKMSSPQATSHQVTPQHLHHNHHNQHLQPQQQSAAAQHSTNHLISDAEFIEIERVMQRASMIEQKETDRVNKLYNRYNLLNRPMGNGETSCYICNHTFGLLSGSPRICHDCLKHICSTCSIDALSSSKQATIWLCKICSEYRDLLKKTGAWFNKRLPKTIETSSSLSPSLSIISNSSSIGKMNHSDFKSKSNSMLNETIGVMVDNDNEDGLKMVNGDKENKDPVLRSSGGGRGGGMAAVDDDMFKKSSFRQQTLLQQQQHDDLNRPFKESTTGEVMKVGTMGDSSSSAAAANLHDLSAVAKLDSPNTTKHHLDQSFNLETSNKLLVDQIASSRNAAAAPHTSSIVNSTAILATPIQVKDNLKSPRNVDAALKASTLNSDSSSLSNVSLAFQKYQPETATGATVAAASQLGQVQFNVEYLPALLQLKINIISATGLPACDSNGFSDPYVKLHLLPGIAKATKLRTKTIYKNLNPVFNETFHYDGVTVSDMETKTLRLTVLDEDKFGFDFIGEYRLPLKTLMRNEINSFNVPLEEKQELGDEADTTFRGKINFALKYSRKNNCLHVKINRCTQLLPMDNGKTSDPFVEISLTPYSKENKQKFRTSIKWKTLDPEFSEEFKFTNIDLKTLLTKTVEIAVWDKDFGSKNDFIGVVQLGQQRTGEELKHFFTVIKNPELYHEQWHTLQLRDDEEASESL